MNNVNFHQPSRITAAKHLRQMLDDGILHPFFPSAKVDADLAEKVGIDLASLIAEAEDDSGSDERQRVVVRSFPVHKVGSLLDEIADLEDHQTHLCSCTAIVEKLKQKGQLSVSEEKLARAYLSSCEGSWPSEPAIEDGAIVYLDDLTVSYLQHLGLLQKISAAGLTAYISSAETTEMKALISY